MLINLDAIRKYIFILFYIGPMPFIAKQQNNNKEDKNLANLLLLFNLWHVCVTVYDLNGLTLEIEVQHSSVSAIPEY